MKKTILRHVIASIVFLVLSAVMIAIIGNNSNNPLIYLSLVPMCLFYYCAIKAIVLFFRQLRNKMLHKDELASSNSIPYSSKYISDNKTLAFEKDPEQITWGRIILIFLVFNPIGLYMIFRKINFETRNHYYNGITMIILGFAVTIPSLIFGILLLPDLLSAIIICTFTAYWILVGIVLIILGFVYKAKGKLINKYINLLFVQKITKINEIARILNRTYSTVSNDIQTLIDNGTLKNIYIYHAEKEVIINEISNKIAIKCINCAGTTVLNKNDEQFCAFCGAKL